MRGSWETWRQFESQECCLLLADVCPLVDDSSKHRCTSTASSATTELQRYNVDPQRSWIIVCFLWAVCCPISAVYTLFAGLSWVLFNTGVPGLLRSIGHMLCSLSAHCEHTGLIRDALKQLSIFARRVEVIKLDTKWTYQVTMLRMCDSFRPIALLFLPLCTAAVCAQWKAFHCNAAFDLLRAFGQYDCLRVNGLCSFKKLYGSCFCPNVLAAVSSCRQTISEILFLIKLQFKKHFQIKNTV